MALRERKRKSFAFFVLFFPFISFSLTFYLSVLESFSRERLRCLHAMETCCWSEWIWYAFKMKCEWCIYVHCTEQNMPMSILLIHIICNFFLFVFLLSFFIHIYIVNNVCIFIVTTLTHAEGERNGYNLLEHRVHVPIEIVQNNTMRWSRKWKKQRKT